MRRMGETVNESMFTYDLTVEVYGIVYIYNPPDPAILGAEDAQDDAAADDADVAADDERPRRPSPLLAAGS